MNEKKEQRIRFHLQGRLKNFRSTDKCITVDGTKANKLGLFQTGDVYFAAVS